MNGYLLFLPAAVFFSAAVVLASLLVYTIKMPIEKLVTKRAQRFVLGNYNRYYYTDDDVKFDERSKYMMSLVGRGYGVELEEYMTRISEDRLPPCVVMNWVRSITEDLAQAPLPAIRVMKWHKMLKHSGSSESVFFHSDFINLEDYEQSFIWGCVNCWLKQYHPDLLNESLEKTIFSYACPKQYLSPYYYITQKMQLTFLDTNKKVEGKGTETNDTNEKGSKLVINVDYHEGDKVGDKTVIPSVSNYQPRITTQNIETPMPPLGQQQEQKQLEDE